MKLIVLTGFSQKITDNPEDFKQRIGGYSAYFKPDDIIISTDVKSEPLLRPFINKFIVSIDNERYHTAGAVKKAQYHFIKEKLIMITNGDTDIDVNFDKFLFFHKTNNSHLSILLKSVNDVSKYGYVSLGNDNRIERYNEKLENLHIKGYVNGGLYLINTDLIFNLAPNIPVSFEKDVFPNIISLNRPIFGYIPNGY